MSYDIWKVPLFHIWIEMTRKQKSVAAQVLKKAKKQKKKKGYIHEFSNEGWVILGDNQHVVRDRILSKLDAMSRHHIKNRFLKYDVFKEMVPESMLMHVLNNQHMVMREVFMFNKGDRK